MFLNFQGRAGERGESGLQGTPGPQVIQYINHSILHKAIGAHKDTEQQLGTSSQAKLLLHFACAFITLG